MKFNDKPGTFNGPAEVRIVRNLPARIDRVWDYFTHPEKRAKWLADGVIEPRVGGKVTFLFKMKNVAPNETPPAEGAKLHECGVEMQGVVTQWDPPFRLGFTFGSTQASDVTIELSRHGNDTQLVITHRTTGEDTEFIYEFAAGWHVHSAFLLAILTDAPLPPFWSWKAQLEAEYKQAQPKPTH